MAQINPFDATQVSPESQFAPVPNGDYPVVITESEVKPTKDGAGQYLQLTLEVIDGHYKGRKIWDSLNLWNKNSTAVEIAQRALSQICHAIGVLQVQDTVMLHNKPLVATLAVRAAGGGYDESNDVKGYKAYASGSAAAQAPVAAAPQAPVQQQAPAAAAPMANKPAWA
jgi:hypothetical protein